MGFAEQSAYRLAQPDQVSRRFLADDQALVRELADMADAGESQRDKIRDTAATLVKAVRRHAAREGALDAFLQQYDLSSQEGVLLMCIAEALLRIPDADTADRLIADKITAASWEDHLGESDSLFVNASTWGLSGTGPKAGGPHYLSRFATEVTVSNNITAVGGNANLLSLTAD